MLFSKSIDKPGWFSKPKWFNGHVAAFGLCAAFMIGVACWGGVRAGWQFEEDYEIFNIQDDLRSGESPAVVAARYMLEDHRRIRLYYWVRTLQAHCFGSHIAWYRWSLVCLGIAASYLAYRWARFWGLAWTESLTWTILLFGGGPMIIWWRMGTAENLGMFFLFLALVAGCRAAKQTERQRVWDAVFTVAVCCMSLSKESFIAVAPAAVFLKIGFEAGPAGFGWKHAIRRNFPVIGWVGAVTVVEMAVIVGWTGTVVGGYVGVDGFSMAGFASAVGGLWGRGSILLAAGSLALAAGCAAVQRRGAWSDAVKTLGPGFAVAVFLTVWFGMLFQKTGIHGHYVLPGRIAALLIPLLVLRFLKLRRARIWRAAVLILAGVSAWPLVPASLQNSHDFWERSETARKLIQTVRSNTRTDDAIVSVVDVGRQKEWSRAMKTYWERLASRENLYLFPIVRPNLTAFEKHCAFDGWDSPVQMYAGRILRSGDAVRRAKLIICFPYTQVWFLVSTKDWFRPGDYEAQIVDNFVVYKRRENPE